MDPERLAWAESMEMKSRLKSRCESIPGDAWARRGLEGERMRQELRQRRRSSNLDSSLWGGRYSTGVSVCFG